MPNWTSMTATRSALSALCMPLSRPMQLPCLIRPGRCDSTHTSGCGPFADVGVGLRVPRNKDIGVGPKPLLLTATARASELPTGAPIAARATGTPDCRRHQKATPLRIASTGAGGGEKGQLRSLRAARMVPSEFVEDLPDDVDEPLPIVLPELLVDGLVVLVDDDDGVLPVPVVVGIVVVVPDVPVVLLLEGVVVLVLLEGVVVVVVVLLDGVVVVLELELDCAIAAPPPINNDAAAMAVVVFKNEPMVMTPAVVETKARRSAVCQQLSLIHI